MSCELRATSRERELRADAQLHEITFGDELAAQSSSLKARRFLCHLLIRNCKCSTIACLKCTGTAASKRRDTDVSSVAILLPRRFPNSSECGPRLSHGGPAFRSFSLKPFQQQQATLFDIRQSAIRLFAGICQPPVHSFAGAGLNSRTGDTLHKRVTVGGPESVSKHASLRDVVVCSALAH